MRSLKRAATTAKRARDAGLGPITPEGTRGATGHDQSGSEERR